MRNHQLFWLGLALGFLIFFIPLKWGPGRDPFDEGINYILWGGGALLTAMALSLYRSGGVAKWVLCVSLGFPTAVLFDMATGSRDYNLWPLTLALSLFIGLIPAFAGACLGKLGRYVFGKVSDKSLKGRQE